MSKNNSNPHKSGDNGGSSTEETDVTIDASGDFEGGDFVAEAKSADDTADEIDATDDDVDNEEGKSAFEKLNESDVDVDEEDDEEGQDDEEKEYDDDNPGEVIEWVIDNCEDDTELDSAEQDFLDAIAEIDDEFIDEHWEEIEERFPPLGLELHEYVRVTNQVDIDWKLNEATPCVCNVRGCFSELEVTKDGMIFPQPLLNFEIKLEERIRLPDDGVTAEFVIDHADKRNVTKQVPPSVFDDKRKFRDEILSTYYSTVFETDDEKQALRDISKYIGSIDVKTIEGVHGIGFGRENTEFVTPGGCIDDSGWVDDPEHKIIEPHGETSITRDYNAEPESAGIDVDEVREITELLCQIRPGERFTPILGWFFATPFRSEIEEIEGMFNHLNITGESGSGKTQTVRLLMRLLGFEIEPFEVNDTAYAIDQKLANVRDCPVWFDEYLPSQKKEHELNRFHDKFKFAATGGVSTRGDYAGGDNVWDLRAPVVVTGESEIISNAESRRTINIRVSSATKDIDDCANAFKKLTGATEIAVNDDDDDGYDVDFNSEFNLAGFAEHFYSFAAGRIDDFESLWKDAQRRAHMNVFDWDITLGDDEIQGLATVCLGYELLHEFADEHGVDGDVLPEEDELEQSLRNVAGVDASGEGTGRMTEEDEFLSLFCRAASAEYVERGTDYEIVRAGKEREELRINVSRCYDKISKYVRDHNLNANLLSNATEYKERFKQKSEEVGTYVKTTSQRTPPVARCTGVSVVDAVDEVADFDVSAIEGTKFVQESHEGESDDGCVDPVANRQVSKLDSIDYEDGENAEISVTVEVDSWEECVDGKAVDACVTDCSATRNVVGFDQPNGFAPEAGDCILMSGVSADVWQGNKQLKLAGSDVEIRRISEGSGFVGGDDDTSVEVLEQ